MAVKIGAILLGVIALAGCAMSEAAPTMLAPTSLPRPTATTRPIDTAWQTITPGIEYREVSITQGDRSERLRLARVDPAQAKFRVLYHPDKPLRVSEWLSQSKATLAVNGNYFDPQNRALSLVIQDGQVSGAPYEGFGGMFAVQGDEVRVRWNVPEPYTGEPLDYALQNFPMLILPGGKLNDQIDDNGRLAPRTAVAQDQSGKIVFVVSPTSAFTLTSFAQWLAASDLNLEVALNLDGDTSSGLVLRNGTHTLGTDSWVQVPDVIVAEPR